MDRLFHRKLKVFALGLVLTLAVFLLCGCAGKGTQAQNDELSENNETPDPSASAELQQTDGTVTTEPEEAAEPAPVEPSPEASPEPTPMPMFDIVDGRTIYLSITEEEFIEIAEFLRKGLGVNDAALAGVLANLQGESGFNPHKIGDSGEAYGLCQWQGARLNQMVEYCEEHGYNPVSLEGQLNFLIHDLKNNYIYAYDQVRLCEDSENGALQATYNFCAYYEAPADPGAESVEREEWTKLLIYPKLNELKNKD